MIGNRLIEIELQHGLGQRERTYRLMVELVGEFTVADDNNLGVRLRKLEPGDAVGRRE